MGRAAAPRLTVIFTISTLLTAPSVASAQGEAPSEELLLAVAPMVTRGPIEKKEVEGLELILAGALQKEPRIRAIMPAEIQTILGMEAQKQLLGCDDNGGCLAEIGGALGAPYVLSTQVSRIGDTWVLQTGLLDAAGGRSLHRATREVDGINPLVKAIKETVAETLLKIPELKSAPGGAAAAPISEVPPPRRAERPSLLYWVGLGVGAAALGAGGFVWMTSESDLRTHNQVASSLVANPTLDRTGLLTLDEVQARKGGRTLGAVVLGIGTVVVAADLALLLTRDKGPGGAGGPTLTLVPLDGGLHAGLTWRIR